jgi:hypothetical protein
VQAFYAVRGELDAVSFRQLEHRAESERTVEVDVQVGFRERFENGEGYDVRHLEA